VGVGFNECAAGFVVQPSDRAVLPLVGGQEVLLEVARRQLLTGERLDQRSDVVIESMADTGSAPPPVASCTAVGSTRNTAAFKCHSFCRSRCRFLSARAWRAASLRRRSSSWYSSLVARQRVRPTATATSSGTMKRVLPWSRGSKA